MKSRIVTLILGGAAAIGAAAIVLAPPNTQTSSPEVRLDPQTAAAPALSGAFTALDPEGTFGRPTAAQSARIARELERALARHTPPSSHTVERFLARGRIAKVLPLTQLNFSVARVGADGVITRDCTSGVDATADFLGGAGPAASSPSSPEEM